jgi:integrase
MAEQEKLLSFLYNDTKYRRWYHDVNILLHTGMRIGEYCGLCVEDIHLDERYINISKQLNYNTSQLSPTKSQAGNRQIPIAEEIIPSLEYIIDRAEAMGNIQPTLNYNGREYTNFINCTSKGNIRTGKIWDTTFKRIREANRDDIYIYPHLLRHTFCSNMATAGMSPKILQKIMGHEKIEMTLNVYAEVNDTTAVLSELDAAMSNLKK